MGNYLFCAKCVCAAFHVSPQRIARQRAIKRNQFQSPTKELSKAHVEEQRLGKYVVMPVGCDVNFTQWWRSLGSSELVIHYPHEKHSNACRVSNSAKPSIMNISFVDANSQSNGRFAESHGPSIVGSTSVTVILHVWTNWQPWVGECAASYLLNNLNLEDEIGALER